MGMFDSVFAECPNCRGQVEFQSKSGDCDLKRYHQQSVPLEVAVGIDGDTETCECGWGITIRLPEECKRIQMRTFCGAGIDGAEDGWD